MKVNKKKNKTKQKRNLNVFTSLTSLKSDHRMICCECNDIIAKNMYIKNNCNLLKKSSCHLNFGGRENVNK